MKYYKTKEQAEIAAFENQYLIGQEMAPPYDSFPCVGGPYFRSVRK